jgi:hypothetical protein
MRRLILEMAGAQECREAYHFVEPDDRHRVVGRSPRSREFSASSRLHLFPRGQADRADRLFELIRCWAAKAYCEGQQDGQRFIRQLADGAYTIDQINDKLARRS